MSSRQRVTFALIAVVIAVVAVVVIVAGGGSGDGGKQSSTAETTPGPSATRQAQASGAAVPKVVITNGQPVGGIKKIEVKQGDQVRFTVVSDVSDEIHVHGYDLMKDVQAGGRVSFSFPATITGIFEAELESRGEQIVSLRVDPK